MAILVVLVFIAADAVVPKAEVVVPSPWFTPALLAAVATLITALTGLVVAIRAHSTATQTQNTVNSTKEQMSQVATQTNGYATELRSRVISLESVLAAAGLPLPSRDPVTGATIAPAPGSPAVAPPTAQP